MNELPIFISYRKDDARSIAFWLKDSLDARIISYSDGTLTTSKPISAFLDAYTLPTDNWTHQLEKELARALVYIVICSPGAKTQFNEDWLYFEMHWWIKNRVSVSPILITPCGQDWIPAPIKEKWPSAQTIDIPSPGEVDYVKNKSNLTLSERASLILEGVSLKVRQQLGCDILTKETPDQTHEVNVNGLYTWKKNKYFQYINCNENYARAAGFDSPHAMIMKTDDDMPWRSLADYFRAGDQKVMDAESPERTHVHEKEIMVDRVADILVTENQILTNTGHCIGVQGYFVDITGKKLVANETSNATIADLNLGEQFGSVSLSPVEGDILKGILRKIPSGKIASDLSLTRAEVDAHIVAIMSKLQCKTLGDVISTAIGAGLPLRLFGIE